MVNEMSGAGTAAVPHLSELPLGHAVPVEDDSCGFIAGGLVELDEQLSHHRCQVLNYFLSGSLDTHRGTVSARMGVHTAHHLQTETIKAQLGHHFNHRSAGQHS